MTDTIIIEKAQAWLNSNIDEKSKAEIHALLNAQDQTELIDSFYKDLEFGTGGLRGLMGVGSNRMNVYTIGMATQGLANYLKASFPEEEISLAITHDSRINNTLFAETTANVLTANGIKVKYFRDMRPTPMLSFAIRHYGCKSGVMVTASHNPKEYNGYKVYWDDGGQVVAPHDKNIIAEVMKIKSIDDVNWAKDDTLKEYIEEDFDNIYLDEVKNLSMSPLTNLAEKDMTIVFSPIHGASGKMVPDALKVFGFENVHVVKEQIEPDGNFPTVKYPNPEETEALDLSIKLAKEINAELVLACDPDGDRYAAVVKNENNDYELLNGNQTGALIIYYLLNMYREQGRLTGNQFTVSTIVTTGLLGEISKGFGVEYYDVLTGFKNIAAVILANEGKKEFIAGGEESYGFLVGDFVRDKDGVSACAVVAEIMAYYKQKGLNIIDVLAEIYMEYGFYKEALISITKKGKDGAEQIQELMKGFRTNKPKSINGIAVSKIVDVQESISYDMKSGTEEKLELDKSNVIQFYLEDGSKISARPSGTEPKIKYYISVNENLPNRDAYRATEASLEAKISALKSFFE
ncbi:phospho-sugar mutase [Cyclobacterium marinum]|uniref:Phosphoglucomutase/phosphomannomutase alpha/beta/alpha domain I n=1 Tax=Cyclobacterium marinum (strain ATCC 25205 / DSM 745 / LMG 13164 / NCIMB 1802) TaxID=880070 RepID=G0J7Z9_CYCMS|nr:phospho-sugar mutase [Cyclobacterium marinum]AEL28668.1 phosphoglucomutase/phosphomannomutase alpha/beta/alpha domain I [Cyclobacterium marinum DSM 745]MBI0398510.1 phospho-sugar mutase [Cyclobacterium marinum]|tara:strand:- start:8354 stop:10081 length:1728 start_codon:yes stop_codon:yes gene_type:complete